MAPPMSWAEQLSDFSAPWCREILESPKYEHLNYPNRRPPPPLDEHVTNLLFSSQLANEHGVRGWYVLRAKETVPPNVGPEIILLCSLGDGLSGFHKRLHGAMTAALIDQITGITCSLMPGGSKLPATSELTVNFRKWVPIPRVVLCRAAVTKVEEPRIWLKASIEDGMGTIFCDGEVQFLRPRERKL